MSHIMNTLTVPDQYQPDELQHSRMNMFFIKSKHAFRQFKNHDYFQTIRIRPAQQNKQRKNRQFVSSPAPFGVNNAYKYICAQVSRNLLAKTQEQKHRSRICSIKDQCLTKSNNTINGDQKMRTTSMLPNLKPSAKKINSHHHSIKSSFPLRESVKLKTQEVVNFLYVDRGSSLSKFLTYQMKFNIYPYIVNTFLKSRISYSDMTQQHFSFLKPLIIQISKQQRQQIDYKDIVNLSSVSQIFLQIQNPSLTAVEKRQLIRYFFIANPTSYEYQLNKIKDEIKRVIGYQFNREMGWCQIFIFKAENGEEVDSMESLMTNMGNFLVGTQKSVVQEYRTYTRQKMVQQKLAQRIKKWKSIAPDNENQIKSQSFHSIPQERYQKLFTSVQKRRDKWVRGKKKTTNNTFKPCQFIDRDKLNKQDDIFQ